jgi:hypothetical protein
VLAETGYYFCRNGPVSKYHLTEEDRVEISSIGVPVQSRNPVFVQVMHRSHVRGNKPGAVVSELPCLDLKKYTKCIEFCIELHSLVSQEAIQISQKQKKNCFLQGLSSEFATKYMGTLQREIILQRASSRGTWHARYSSSKSSCTLGWCSFAEDNGILEHDVCLFELMQGARRPTMTVHVLRKERGRFVLLR